MGLNVIKYQIYTYLYIYIMDLFINIAILISKEVTFAREICHKS